MKKFLLIFLMLSFYIGFKPTPAYAQCAMCKAVAESNMKNKENSQGKGLNKGIIYLLSVPYIIGGVVGFIWFRKRKQIKAYLNE